MKPYYEYGGITIYHGDCRAMMPMRADLVITDPPYGINYQSSRVAPSTTAQWMKQQISGDEDSSARDMVLGHFTEWACFGTHKMATPVGTMGVLIWDKGPASGMGNLAWPWKNSWEHIYIRGQLWRGSRDEGVIKGHWIVTRASMGRTHPNEKPISLLVYLLQKHPGQLILDPFMGSGTTLVAAKNLGRKAIGIEIEEKYCEIAAKRLGQEVFEFKKPDEVARQASFS